ncbi:hypothetical protein K435DRAFT_699855, partial [Dendrothele bispora CBS 962.96]
SSTHNTRIERLWVEVGRQFVRQWRAFFFRLEDLHGLERDNPHHLWIIHYLFLKSINEDCTQFQQEWNRKPLTGLARKHSPEELLLSGMLEHGIYVDTNPPDDCEGLTIAEIEEGYGVHGNVQSRAPGQTGAGHSLEDQLDDERDSGAESTDDDEDWEDIPTIDDKFTAPAVKVPRMLNPFSKQLEEIFSKSLSDLRAEEIIPEGFKILPQEWEDSTYPSYYHIRSGRKTNQALLVELPDLIWRPRSELWVQALSVYNHLKAELELF